MVSNNLQTLARLPFLTEATEFVKNLKLSIDSILDNIAYRSAWSRGKQRLQETLEFGEIQEHGASSDAEYINELLSYVIARIIVSCIKDQYLVKRYALAEAVYAYHELQNHDTRFIADVANQFDLKSVEIKETVLDLSLPDYLQYSTPLRAPEWKLVNRELKNGCVSVTKRELARLLQEALRIKLQTELPVEVNAELKDRIVPQIKDIVTLVQSRKQKYETRDLGKVSITRFPPCIKHLLGMTQAGENVSHLGRFALASFLHTIGLTSDQILETFSTSPDFNVEKARYQVEHITGKISGTEYTPPSCDTMKSNSICFNPDDLCQRDWLNHPLKYYRIKGKRKNKEKKENKNDSQ